MIEDQQPQEAPEVEAPPRDYEAEAPPRNYEAEAREMGWVPEDEWKGDPDRWRPADKFVQRGEEILPIVQSRLRAAEKKIEAKEREMEARAARLEKMHEESRQMALEAQRRELEKQMESAVEFGDVEALRAARTKERELNRPPEPAKVGPPAEVLQWVSRNSWFDSDVAANAVAKAEAGRVADMGGDVNEQLKAAEAVVRKRFPEHFSLPPSPEGGGTAPPPSRRREKGPADLPSEAKRQMESDLRRREWAGKTAKDWAATYWSIEQ